MRPIIFPFMRSVVFTLGDLHVMADAVVAIEMFTPPTPASGSSPAATRKLIDATLRNEDYIATELPDPRGGYNRDDPKRLGPGGQGWA